jgi:hypothetical protein
MAFQEIKASACGHELGSSMLFGRRIGFSGTPSNLLPIDLGECFYEPGSDGNIVSVLSDPNVTTAEVLSDDWGPRMLLRKIATSEPPFHALIDTVSFRCRSRFVLFLIMGSGRFDHKFGERRGRGGAHEVRQSQLHAGGCVAVFTSFPHRSLPPQFEGVTFLDRSDRQMVTIPIKPYSLNLNAEP